MSAETSQKIKNMSIVCALLVVIIHVTWPTEKGCLTWFINELVARQGIARIAVPFFFVVSGFFLAAHFDEKGWWSREIKKRVRSLGVPFFVWNILAYLMLLLQNILVDYIAHRPFGTSVVLDRSSAKILDLVLDIGAGRINCPTWYIRCLFLFILFSPLFKMGIRRFRIGWIILAFFIGWIPHFFPNTPGSFWERLFDRWLSLADIFYFAVGIYLRDCKIQIHARPLLIVCAVYGFGFLIARTIVHAYGMEMPFVIGSLFLPAMMYVVWHIMPTSALPKWLTACSFPLYVLHIIIMRPVEAVLKTSSLNVQIQSILVCIICIVVSIIVTNLLRKYLPRVSNFLFAGRA